MLHITIDSAQDWYEHVSLILKNRSFPGARVHIPKKEVYVTKVSHIIDRAGLRLTFAQYEPMKKLGG